MIERAFARPPLHDAGVCPRPADRTARTATIRTLLLTLTVAALTLATAAPGPVDPSPAAVPSAAVPTVWTDDRAAAIDDYVRRAFEDSGLPAVAVAVVTPEGVVYERTLGTTALRDGVPLTPGFAFEIGSLTKSLTALAVLQLAEEGRVDLSAPVQRYLPWFRVADEAASRSITLEQLLTHTSGLHANGHGVVWHDVGRIDGSVPEAVRELASEPADAPRPTYANMNYVTAGAVLEAVTGQPWDVVLEERILTPLGMTSSAAGLDRREGIRTVTGHALTFGLLPYATRPIAPFAGPAGSIAIATPGDFAAYVRAWLTPGSTSVVSPWVAAEALAPRVEVDGEPAYGLGWRSMERNGRPVAHHSAGTEGAGAFMALATDAGVGVVVFTNMASGLPGAIGYGVLDLALGDTPTPTGRDPLVATGFLLLALALSAAASLVVVIVRAWRAFGGAARPRSVPLHVGRIIATAAVAGFMWWAIPGVTAAMGMPLPFGFRGFTLDVFVTAVLLMAVPTVWAVYLVGRLVQDGVRGRAAQLGRATAG